MKKFSISSDVLKPAMEKLGQAVNEKTILPATKNIYCIVSKGEVQLITTDMENFISYKCAAETFGQDGYELLLPFDFLNRVVGFSKSVPVMIEHPSARKAKIISGDDVYELNSLDKAEDFPEVPATPKKPMHKLTGEFILLLTKALLTCSKDNMRPSMTRVCMDMKPGDVNLVSTDTFVMYKHKLPVEVTEEIQLQFSPKTIKVIEGMESVELSWTAKKICLKGELLTVWSTRHDDKYPNYNGVIPNYEANLEVNKDQLVEALNKALISNNSSRQTSMLPKKENGFLHFETDDSENSRMIHVKIPGEFSGDTEQVTINAKKMLTVMKQVDAEKVKLHLHSATKAILFSTEEDADYLGLLMPILPKA